MKLKHFFKFLLTVLLICFLLINNDISLAQDTVIQDNEKVMIVLDGKLLFKVGSIDNFTAQERAELINSNLVAQVTSLEPLKLEFLVGNKQVVIRNLPDETHILNVTQSDVISGTTIEDQAKVWRDILQNHLIQGRKERASSYILNHLFKTILAIIFAIFFNIFIYFFCKFCVKKLAWLHKNPASPFYNLETLFNIIWNLTIFSLQVGVWIWILYYISEVFPYLLDCT